MFYFRWLCIRTQYLYLTGISCSINFLLKLEGYVKLDNDQVVLLYCSTDKFLETSIVIFKYYLQLRQLEYHILFSYCL